MKRQRQDPPVRGVAGHQKVNPTKIELSKKLRKEMTPEEKKLWKHLRSNQFGGLHFRRQQIINGFIVDFYCHGLGLAIEVDGSIHSQQKDYDTSRDEALRQRGFRIIRFSNNEVRVDIDLVLSKIKKACKIET